MSSMHALVADESDSTRYETLRPRTVEVSCAAWSVPAVIGGGGASGPRTRFQKQIRLEVGGRAMGRIHNKVHIA